MAGKPDDPHAFHPWFPMGKLRPHALAKFLENYKINLFYEREILLQYITLRISLYYIQTLSGRFVRPTIAGLPIRISNLKKIITELTSGKFGKAIPGVTI